MAPSPLLTPVPHCWNSCVKPFRKAAAKVTGSCVAFDFSDGKGQEKRSTAVANAMMRSDDAQSAVPQYFYLPIVGERQKVRGGLRPNLA
jgi:hypothetical protein